VEEGFLVSDGHLSSEEYNFSIHSQQLGDKDRHAEILLRRQKYKETFTAKQPQLIAHLQPFVQT
jgi:hypothetical protein